MTAGPYMMTCSGRRFYFHDPDPASIDLYDIDFALRHLNRFTGHVGSYHVATHSVAVMRCAIELGADELTIRAALMHDAHEAFVGDISSPLKAAIGPAFAEIDRRAAQAVAQRFQIGEWYDHEIVHKADRMVTAAEALAFMGDRARVWAVDPWQSFEPNRRYSFMNACASWGIE